jgi:CheY-like chemotaxis protein
MKVLIVDDEPDIRRIARLSLSRLGGMEVVEAESGPSGVRQATLERPDAILLDVMMPGMDGPATLETLRTLPETANIPVLFLTAKVMPSEQERLRSLGARAVLAKPFDVQILPDLVRRALEGP